MTQEAFSKYTGIPKRSIENWEGGKRQPPEYLVKMLERIVKEDFKGGEWNRPFSCAAVYTFVYTMYTKCGILTQNLEKHFKIKNPETLGFISFPWVSGIF